MSVVAPFTVPHFERWARDLILDSGESWVVEDFQAAFLEDVFAGVPEAWLIVPECNGKTTLIAGLVLYHCLFRQDAWVPVAASSRDQAEILYRQAEGFVLRSDSLRPHFLCQEGYRRIRLVEDADSRRRVRQATAGSRIQIMAADDRHNDGIIGTMPVLEELHRHRDLRLYRTWRGKLGKRSGAQLVAISTAGEPGSEFEEAREAMRTGSLEIERNGCFVRAASPSAVLHDWAVPADGDSDDLELVKEANPFSGVTIEELAEKWASPAMTTQHWRRFTCNLATRSVLAAIDEAEWHRAATDDRIPVGEPIWLGLDVAWKYDTTAAVPYWMPEPNRRLLGPASILVPPRDGNQLKQHVVEAAILAIHEDNPIQVVVLDPHDAHSLIEWLSGTLGVTVIERQQTNVFACADYAAFMEALRNGWLRHAGDRGLAAHALNAVAKLLPGGQVRFDRPAKQSKGFQQDQRVIDGLVAAAMVHSAATAVVEEPSSWRPLNDTVVEEPVAA